MTGILAFVALLVGARATASPPRLYDRAAHEGPVSGGPDDLLLLAGYGFAAGDTVIYRALSDTTRRVSTPDHTPSRSTEEFGSAEVVSYTDVPYSLTVKLPQIMRPDQSYALWVRTARGEWSKAVRINDARPLWITPSYVYASASPASLPREIKVVGRNLQPAAGGYTHIRLSGPRELEGSAISDSLSSETLNHYVARLQITGTLVPGSYRIDVSRDGVSWVRVPGQSLEVRPDPPATGKYSVGDVRFGGCRPDDGADDTACILRAIAAAKEAGGGSVDFGPGTWNVIDSRQAGLIGDEGIVVPVGVSIRGAGSDKTRLARHAEWSEQAPAAAVFTLLGHTQVTGFTFRDLKVYQPREKAGPFLQLGEHYERVAADPASSAGASIVDDVTITGNTFDRTMVAIGSGGLPVTHLFVTYNTFGSFLSSLELGGNPFNMAFKFRIDDTVIAHNTFKPGSRLDLVGKTGTLVSELGAGSRVDFTGNSADGASVDYLYSPQDARGWRATYFWNMSNNVEEVLVSQNTASCTGDKIGDGEAISMDNNANTFAFAAAAPVRSATASSVAVSQPLAARQNGRDVPLATYYIDHWVQVVDGPGLGQARKIVRYSTDPITQLTTLVVAPDWDVIPVSGRSRISVGREFWQFYVLDNQVDDRRPLCQKSNRSRHDAGGITVWAQSADSVIAGNRQYDSDGILVQQAYVPAEHPCPDCTMQGFFQSFLEIRSNIVDGEYDWAIDCSASGIAIGAAAASTEDAVPPTVGFGVSIARNTIRHADGQSGGAIAQMSTWEAGPAPHRWPLSDALLIHHNAIAEIDGPRAMPVCGKSRPRTGIAFPDPDIAWHTVLYANSCKEVTVPVGPGGVDIASICPSSVEDSCECPRPAP